MIEHIFMLGMGVVCFLIAFMNDVTDDKFWFAQLIAFVSIMNVPVALVFSEGTLIFVIAMAWQLMVVMIGKAMDLKKYHIILWLYPFVMMTIFLEWIFWKIGVTDFNQVYVSVFYGTNVIQALLLLVLSDAGCNLTNRVRDRGRSGYVLDDNHHFQDRG